MGDAADKALTVAEHFFEFIEKYGVAGGLLLSCACLASMYLLERRQRVQIDDDYKRLLLDLVAVNRQLQHEKGMKK